MLAYGAIAEFAIAGRGASMQSGVSILVPVSAFSFSLIANDAKAGSVINVAASGFNLTALANAPSGGTLIDVMPSQLVLLTHLNNVSVDVSVDMRSTFVVSVGGGIGEGAITEPWRRSMIFKKVSTITLRAPISDAVSGALVGVEPTAFSIIPKHPEIIARTRHIGVQAINS